MVLSLPLWKCPQFKPGTLQFYSKEKHYMLSHYAFIAHISLWWLLLMLNSFKFTLKRKEKQNKSRMDKAWKPHSFCFLSIVLLASVLGHGCIKLLGKVQAIGRNPAFSRSEGTREKCLVPFNKQGPGAFIIELLLNYPWQLQSLKLSPMGSFASSLPLSFATIKVINLMRSKQNQLSLFHSSNHFIPYLMSVLSLLMFSTVHFLQCSLRVVCKNSAIYRFSFHFCSWLFICRWHSCVLLATQKAEPRRPKVQGLPGQLSETLY